MTTEIFGSELGSFTPSDSIVHEDNTASGNFNTSFARASMEADGSSRYFEGVPANDYDDEAWLHFEWANDTNLDGTATRFIWYDASGNAKVRIRQSNSADTLAVEYWDGAAWTTAGSSISIVVRGVRNTFDLRCVVNSASGAIELYVAGNPRIASGTIDLSGITELKKFRFFGASISTTNHSTFVSQVVVSDEATIGGRLMTYYINGAGASAGFTTGTYAEVDEAVNNDADFIASTAADQVSMFAATTVSAITGYTLRAVGVTARARRGSTGPQNLQLGIRVAGTNYFSSTFSLGLGYTPVINTWEESPATSSAWVNSELTGLQIGCKSIT